MGEKSPKGAGAGKVKSYGGGAKKAGANKGIKQKADRVQLKGGKGSVKRLRNREAEGPWIRDVKHKGEPCEGGGKSREADI